MRYAYSQWYIKKYDSYSRALQELIAEADNQIKAYYENQTAPYGLRIKKLANRTYEARVTDKIRLIWTKDQQQVYFALLGTHDDVRRFIKKL